MMKEKYAKIMSRENNNKNNNKKMINEIKKKNTYISMKQKLLKPQGQSQKPSKMSSF